MAADGRFHGVTGAAGQDEPVVYVVDDDRELSDSVAWLLGSLDIDSRCFGDPEEFLGAVQPQQWGCVVLDVRMPRMSGFDVQERLAELDSCLSVVFVSAHGDIPMSVRALRAGAVEFLEKPYDPQHLLDSIQVALRTSRTRLERATASARLRHRLAQLSEREIEVLDLVVEGLPSKNVATRLGISVKTVDVHRTRIREKTGAVSIPVLVRDILLSGARTVAELTGR
ncbi:response regulator [Kineococcus sp. R8]|uniref:response regulator transcription factor n=1 Tax=Kineococcus siccus TaxID=2696567 RepID=UPI001411CB3D|nr:response regulator [Kineococcus siccus]NAZ80412.1 response regulator [Kineococcus siccus]